MKDAGKPLDLTEQLYLISGDTLNIKIARDPNSEQESPTLTQIRIRMIAQALEGKEFKGGKTAHVTDAAYDIHHPVPLTLCIVDEPQLRALENDVAMFKRHMSHRWQVRIRNRELRDLTAKLRNLETRESPEE